MDILPPITHEEYEQLREDIRLHGVLVPIFVDEQGRVIDGNNRLRAAQEVGRDCPVVVLTGLSEEDKLEVQLRANVMRRHLKTEEKKQIAIELRKRGWTLERIARLVGNSKSTVHYWLGEMPEDELPDYSEGEHRYPLKKRGSVRTTLKELPKVLSVLDETEVEGDIDSRQLARHHRKELIWNIGGGKECQAIVSDFIESEKIRGMVRCVVANLTTEHDEETVNALCAYADEVLEENGIVLLFAPVSYWQLLMETFGEQFELCHVFAVVHRAGIMGKFIQDWKPLFYFVRDEHFSVGEMHDAYVDTLTGALFHVLEKLTEPNDIIIAPLDDEHIRNASISRTITIFNHFPLSQAK